MGRPISVLVAADAVAGERIASRLAAADEPLAPTVESDPEAVLDRLDEVDCLVAERDLDGTDALSLLDSVRARAADLPFLLFTAEGSERLASRAITAGVTDYLPRTGERECYDLLARRAATAGGRYRSERRFEQLEQRYRHLVDQDLVGVYLVQDGRLEHANRRAAEIFGYAEPDRVIGRPVSELVAPEDRERVREQLRKRESGQIESIRHTFTGLRRDGERVEVEVHGSAAEHQGTPAVIGVVLKADARRRAINTLDRAAADLSCASDSESAFESAIDQATNLLDSTFVGVFLARDDKLAPAATSDSLADAFDGDPPAFRPADGTVWNAYESEMPVTIDTWKRGGSLRSAVAVPIGVHGVLLAASRVPRDFDAADVDAVQLLATNLAGAIDRIQQERRLAELHEATRDLMSAQTKQAVAEISTDTARDVLGLEINAIWFPTDDGRLEPAAQTERATVTLGTLPTFEPGGSLAWRTFETGEPQRWGDVREAPVLHNPDTPMRSEVQLPLGDRGLFIAGSTTPNDFDQIDISLGKVFAANVEVALARADREETIRDRTSEVERQNERLERFTSVVSHDLRNPLNVIQGRIDLARQDHDDDRNLDVAARATDRMDQLIEDLLALARQGRTVGDTESVDLEPLVREIWRTVDGSSLGTDDGLRVDASFDADVTLRVDGELGSVAADRSRLRQLLENLLFNAIEHGTTSDQNATDSDDAGRGSVTVTVGRLREDTGFYVADDGPGVPPDEREKMFEFGYSGSDGTGFGLAIVETIAEAHGWTVAVGESDAGGARLEIHT